MCNGKHPLSVLILGFAIPTQVLDSVINRYVLVTVRPQEIDAVDTLDDAVVFAGILLFHQGHCSSTWFVDDRVIND